MGNSETITSMNSSFDLDFRSFTGDTSNMDFNPWQLCIRGYMECFKNFGREFATIGVFDTVWGQKECHGSGQTAVRRPSMKT
jgi:hypothetical protein